MNYSEQNWKECLEALGFTEIKNPNGIDCYDILDDKGIPVWQYETIEKKLMLYYFFCGAEYMKMHLGLM